MDYVDIIIILGMGFLIIVLLLKFTDLVDASNNLDQMNGKSCKVERTLKGGKK